MEGIYKRVSSQELVHTLSYSGDGLNSPQPLMWRLSNDNRELFKELKKMEDSSKKDLSEVKKRILKSRFEEYLVTNNEVIKRLQAEERLNLKGIETSIRGSLEKDK